MTKKKHKNSLQCTVPGSNLSFLSCSDIDSIHDHHPDQWDSGFVYPLQISALFEQPRSQIHMPILKTYTSIHVSTFQFIYFQSLITLRIKAAVLKEVRIHQSLLNPWSRVHLEKLSGFQQLKKFPAFYGNWRFITTFTNARHLSLSWATSIQSMPHIKTPEGPS